MRKVKIETIRKEANVQIIPVDASFIAKTINAMHICEMEVETLKSCATDKAGELLKTEVFDFLLEIYNAFLEVDED